MKIFLLGAGYVGEAFGREQKEKGHTIIAATRFENKLEKIRTWADEAIVWTGQVPAKVDVCLFAVAPHGEGYRETYLHNALLLANADVPHILYTSSTSVYGDHGGNEVTEDSPLLPVNESQKVLIETENALPKDRSCIFRLGEIVGPGRELEKRVREKSVFPGTGEQFTNISPLNLILRSLDLAIIYRLKGIYNLVTIDHPTRKELFKTIAKKIGSVPPTWDTSIASPHGGNKRVNSDRFFQLVEKFTKEHTY